MKTLDQRIAYRLRPTTNLEKQKTLQFLLNGARRSYRELDRQLFIATLFSAKRRGDSVENHLGHEFYEARAQLAVQLGALARLQPLLFDHKSYQLDKPSNQREAWLQVVYLLADVQSRRTLMRQRVPAGSHLDRYHHIMKYMKRLLVH